MKPLMACMLGARGLRLAAPCMLDIMAPLFLPQNCRPPSQYLTPHLGWYMRLSGINYCASRITKTERGTEILLRCGFNASKNLPLVGAWQQRPPPGCSDMMIEWLKRCEQEAEGIRRSCSHAPVPQCGVSLEGKPASVEK